MNVAGDCWVSVVGEIRVTRPSRLSAVPGWWSGRVHGNATGSEAAVGGVHPGLAANSIRLPHAQIPRWQHSSIGSRVMVKPLDLPFDPIERAGESWERAFGPASSMRVATSIMRVQQILLGRYDELLRGY